MAVLDVISIIALSTAMLVIRMDFSRVCFVIKVLFGFGTSVWDCAERS